LIDRRKFLKDLGMLATAAATSSPLARAASSRKPNIVVILADDLGFGDLSCYGAAHVQSPAIDALARSGIRFTNAHADAATCTPIASVLKSAGYATGLVGKWHIGLGDGPIDWNSDIKPGPCELGFDDAFFFAATADRVPTVFINNHRVVGLDPKDPIHVSYGPKIGNEPTGRENPEMLKQKLSEGHDGTIVDGISRIGTMTGGKTARWKDEEMAATFTNKACEFIEQNKDRPFLLYFTPSDIHVPRAPAAAFAGKNACGVRCDVINQLDWSVSRITETLKKHNLTEDTLIVFTSDNGPVVNDGYDDGSDRKLDGHRPAGPLRGGKYSIYEGGTREPFLVSWPAKIKPGVSPALISQLDLLRSFADITGANVPKGGAPDSIDVSAALLGRTEKGREVLVEEADVLAIRDIRWKLVVRSQRPGTQPAKGDGMPPTSGPALTNYRRAHALHEPWTSALPAAPIELYDLANDPAETRNVAEEHPDVVERLRSRLIAIRSGSQ
jgi:arylsulfatase A-like enzyme